MLGARQRILLARGMALLQSGDGPLRDLAVAEIDSLRDAIVGRPVQDAHLLYNLACWYGIAAREGAGPGNAADRTRRYLAGPVGAFIVKPDPTFRGLVAFSTSLQQGLGHRLQPQVW